MMKFASTALAAALLFSGAAPLAAAKTAPLANVPVAANASQLKLDGFRSAHWGMSIDQVRAAIRSDFKLDGAAVKQTTDVAQGTRILVVSVPNLLPDSGKALVTYIFGARSQKLIEVNVVWSPALDPAITPDRLVQTAAVLARYFAAAGYAPRSVKTNLVAPDGAVLMFSGSDSAGHATTLLLRRAPAKDQNGKNVFKAGSLLLAYSADPAKPDVYRIQPGQF